VVLPFFNYKEQAKKNAVNFSLRLSFKAQRQLTANSESKCSMPMHIHMFNIQTCIIMHICTPSQTHSCITSWVTCHTKVCMCVCVRACRKGEEQGGKLIRPCNPFLLFFLSAPHPTLISLFLASYIFSHLISWTGNKFHVFCATHYFIYLFFSLLQQYRISGPDSIIRQVASPAF